ncbi:30S ribosomal protein S8 [Candidatus Saccharibacteria bacterium]|nr:30S ribosomal protein S8 [Candidatus Saccharibacteria bacterium]
MSTTTTDPIADMLTRIRNAIGVRKNEVSLPHSKVKQSVAELLKQTNFIDDVKVEGEGISKQLILTINTDSSNARITEIARISKPGRRYYVRSQEIPTVKRGRGVVIVSTSKGIMTGDEAKKQNVGGELICKVY